MAYAQTISVVEWYVTFLNLTSNICIGHGIKTCSNSENYFKVFTS
jgi:hypothetical protein